jgi:hypothetical protein
VLAGQIPQPEGTRTLRLQESIACGTKLLIIRGQRAATQLLQQLSVRDACLQVSQSGAASTLYEGSQQLSLGVLRH